MRSSTFILLGALVAVACSGKRNTTALVAGEPVPWSTVMQGHFVEATALRAAVVAGDLQAARDAGQGLETSSLMLDVDARWKPHLDSLVDAAGAVGQASTLDVAAQASARVGLACARCHEAIGSGPAATLGDVVSRDNAPEDHMRLHQWATGWLWVGLVASHDGAWDAGSAALKESRFDSRFAEDGSLADLEQRVHALAIAAASTERMEDRAVIYGDLLATCSACHNVARDR